MKYTSLSPYIILRKMLDKINNASSKGVEFDLTLKDVHDLFNKGNGLCAYSGEEFKNAPDITIERINPLKGYVRGNVCLVRANANCAKAHVDTLMHSDLVDLETKERILKLSLKMVRQEIKDKAIEEERRVENDATRTSRLAEMTKAMRGLK
ncbi:decoy of host sigma70 [Proteus phage J3S]